MNTRLQQFMTAENISQSQLADSLGVARASVSHIIAGRNKPGFDFIENMTKRYPNLNIEWLITGSGKMYKSSTNPVDKTKQTIDNELFVNDTIEKQAIESSLFPSFYDPQSDSELIKDTSKSKSKSSPFRNVQTRSDSSKMIDQHTSQSPFRVNVAKDNYDGVGSVKKEKSIFKILVLFDDGSFQMFKD